MHALLFGEPRSWLYHISLVQPTTLSYSCVSQAVFTFTLSLVSLLQNRGEAMFESINLNISENM